MYLHVTIIVNLTDFEKKLEEFTELEMSINGIKKRTAKGYALKDVCVWWLFQEHKDSLESKGFTWKTM